MANRKLVVLGQYDNKRVYRPATATASGGDQGVRPSVMHQTFVASAATVSNTVSGEQLIVTDVLPADLLTADGDMAVLNYRIVLPNTSTEKIALLKIGGYTIFDSDLLYQNQRGSLTCELMRQSSSVVECLTHFQGYRPTTPNDEKMSETELNTTNIASFSTANAYNIQLYFNGEASGELTLTRRWHVYQPAPPTS